MKQSAGQAKDWRDDSLRIAEELVLILDSLSERTVPDDSWPGLVDLLKARKDARSLRDMLLKHESKSVVEWECILRSLTFLAQLIKDIHSLLNCKFVLVYSYDYRSHHKTLANGRTHASARTRVQAGSNTFVPVPTGEWKKAARTPLAA